MTKASRAVLGIDAAWTDVQPSGVALAVQTDGDWRLVAVESSYDRFVRFAAGAGPDDTRPFGSAANPTALLDAATRLGAAAVDVIAIDMPLGPEPIIGRRTCDDEISRCYGARKASVHSPTRQRPGKVSETFCNGFASLGYRVCLAPPACGLIEVYPHAALIEFMDAPERLPYKAAKTRSYWPKLGLYERRAKLREIWRHIVSALERRIAGTAAALPIPAVDIRGWELKAFEDKLDAVTCAAIAVACLDGKARAFGDATGVIWVPALTTTP